MIKDKNQTARDDRVASTIRRINLKNVDSVMLAAKKVMHYSDARGQYINPIVTFLLIGYDSLGYEVVYTQESVTSFELVNRKFSPATPSGFEYLDSNSELIKKTALVFDFKESQKIRYSMVIKSISPIIDVPRLFDHFCGCGIINKVTVSQLQSAPTLAQKSTIAQQTVPVKDLDKKVPIQNVRKNVVQKDTPNIDVKIAQTSVIEEKLPTTTAIIKEKSDKVVVQSIKEVKILETTLNLHIGKENYHPAITTYARQLVCYQVYAQVSKRLSSLTTIVNLKHLSNAYYTAIYDNLINEDVDAFRPIKGSEILKHYTYSNSGSKIKNDETEAISNFVSDVNAIFRKAYRSKDNNALTSENCANLTAVTRTIDHAKMKVTYSAGADSKQTIPIDTDSKLRLLYKGQEFAIDAAVFVLLSGYNYVFGLHEVDPLEGTSLPGFGFQYSFNPPLLSESLYECFASPINSISSHYSSPLPTDLDFGSVGKFATNRKFEEMYIQMNPPWTENCLAYAASMITEFSPFSELIFYGPDWKDSEYYAILCSIIDKFDVTVAEAKEEYITSESQYSSSHLITKRINSLIFVIKKKKELVTATPTIIQYTEEIEKVELQQEEDESLKKQEETMVIESAVTTTLDDITKQIEVLERDQPLTYQIDRLIDVEFEPAATFEDKDLIDFIFEPSTAFIEEKIEPENLQTTIIPELKFIPKPLFATEDLPFNVVALSKYASAQLTTLGITDSTMAIEKVIDFCKEFIQGSDVVEVAIVIIVYITSTRNVMSPVSIIKAYQTGNGYDYIHPSPYVISKYGLLLTSLYAHGMISHFDPVILKDPLNSSVLDTFNAVHTYLSDIEVEYSISASKLLKSIIEQCGMVYLYELLPSPSKQDTLWLYCLLYVYSYSIEGVRHPSIHCLPLLMDFIHSLILTESSIAPMNVTNDLSALSFMDVFSSVQAYAFLLLLDAGVTVTSDEDLEIMFSAGKFDDNRFILVRQNFKISVRKYDNVSVDVPISAVDRSNLMGAIYAYSNYIAPTDLLTCNNTYLYMNSTAYNPELSPAATYIKEYANEYMNLDATPTESDMYNCNFKKLNTFGKKVISLTTAMTEFQYTDNNDLFFVDDRGYGVVDCFEDDSGVHATICNWMSKEVIKISTGKLSSVLFPPLKHHLAANSSSIGVVTVCEKSMKCAFDFYLSRPLGSIISSIGSKTLTFNAIFRNTPHRMGIDPYINTKKVANAMTAGTIITSNGSFDIRRLSHTRKVRFGVSVEYACHLCGNIFNTDFGRKVCQVYDSIHFTSIHSSDLVQNLVDRLKMASISMKENLDPKSPEYYYNRLSKGSLSPIPMGSDNCIKRYCAKDGEYSFGRLDVSYLNDKIQHMTIMFDNHRLNDKAQTIWNQRLHKNKTKKTKL